MRKYILFHFVCLLALGTGFLACNKDDDSKPVITKLRASSPAPNDSTLTTAGPGQTVVIQGSGFASTTNVYFNGYPTYFNSALLSDNNIVVTIPADMPFGLLNPTDLNTVRVVTRNGEVLFNFPIVPPSAVVSAATNENAPGGERITLYGQNFFFVEKVIFPGGVEVTNNLVSATSGLTLEVTVPAGLTQGGRIQVVTKFGTGISAFLFNDLTTGMLVNFDNASYFEWGCTVTEDAALFPGNRGKYGLFERDNIGGNNWEWWTGNRALITTPVNWLPDSELSKSAADYALKFELYVKDPWTTGCLFIGPPPGDDWIYMCRYEPWKAQANFTTPGWRTVIIPLNNFKKKNDDGVNGAGNPAATVGDILDGIDERLRLMFVNDTNDPLVKLNFAIDNLRVLKL